MDDAFSPWSARPPQIGDITDLVAPPTIHKQCRLNRVPWHDIGQCADLISSRASAPAQRGRDVRKDRFDHVGIVFDAERVRHGQKQRVGLGDGLIPPQFFD